MYLHFVTVYLMNEKKRNTCAKIKSKRTVIAITMSNTLFTL
jgi:hypothetical protein